DFCPGGNQQDGNRKSRRVVAPRPVLTKTTIHPMKKKSASQSAFFKLRVLLGVLLCFAAIMVVLFALGKASAQPRALPAPASPPTDGFAAANQSASRVMVHTATGQQAQFFIELADQADRTGPASLGTKA